jgi:ATP synthase protein I
VVAQRGSQSLLSLGLEWSSRITTIGLEFSIPALLGFGVDHWLRTSPAATVTGAFLGFGVGMLHALRMAKELSTPGSTEYHSAHKRPEPTGLSEQDDRSGLS